MPVTIPEKSIAIMESINDIDRLYTKKDGLFTTDNEIKISGFLSPLIPVRDLQHLQIFRGDDGTGKSLLRVTDMVLRVGVA